MAKQNNKATVELTADELKAESAVLALVHAGMRDHVDAFLTACGMATSAEEYEAARPLSKAEIAAKALAACGVDIASLKPAKASSKALALNLDALAKAVEKYGKHAVVFDSENGTSICTHFMLNALANTGRVSLSDTLAHVRQYKPTFASSGHYNTIKRLLRKAGYTVNSSQGFFTVSA